MQAHNNGDYGSDARAIDVDDESSSCSFIDYFLLHRNHWRKLVKNIGGGKQIIGEGNQNIGGTKHVNN